MRFRVEKEEYGSLTFGGYYSTLEAARTQIFAALGEPAVPVSIEDAIEAWDDPNFGGRFIIRAESGRIVYTTASPSYDYGCTETRDSFDFDGRAWRAVEIFGDDGFARSQDDRYASGCYGSLTEDPRVTAQRIADDCAQRTARQKADDDAHAAGLAWLAALSDAELDEASDEDPTRPGFTRYETRRVRFDEVKAERVRRSAFAAETVRCAEWARCAALIPSGCAIVDDGDPGGYSTEAGYSFRRPRRDSRIYYACHIRGCGNPETADVACAPIRDRWNSGSVGSLTHIADLIARGTLRVADPETIPPQGVLDRIGHDQLANIRHIDVDGRRVWIGCALFATDVLILDERGHKIRAKRILEAVREAQK